MALTTAVEKGVELSLSILTAIFQVNLGLFTEAKDDGGGGDTCTGAISRAKLQSNHHHLQTIQFFYRPDALPVAQPTVSKHSREKISHSMDLLTKAHLDVFQLCL